MKRYRILDLYCCQGGAARGYHNAGFDVVGVDKDYQHRYPYHFVQDDVFNFLKKIKQFKFDAIHASPPCQRYSCLTPKSHRQNHPDDISRIREEIVKTGLPYILENVTGARNLLINPVMLCGSMFDLKIFRHRFFEIGFDHEIHTAQCNHNFAPIIINGRSSRLHDGKRKEYTVAEKSQGLGVDWMSTPGLDEAIPPAYTEFLGKELMRHLNKPRF